MAESEHAGSDARRGPVARFQEFLHLESSGGLVLMAVSALAMIIANSPFAEPYNGLLDLPFEIRLGDASLAKPLILWINDGLMAVFFLLVGITPLGIAAWRSYSGADAALTTAERQAWSAATVQ